MKKQILFYVLLMSITSLIFVGCQKKDEATPAPTPTPTTPAASDLCDGKGSSWFPLKLNNHYVYDVTGFTFDYLAQDTTTKMVGGHRFYHLYESSQYSDWYLRVDAAGNAFVLDNFGSEDTMMIANPVLNYTWNLSGGGNNIATITSMSQTLTTSKCSYTGLIEVSISNTSSGVYTKYYMKKGLGMVYKWEYHSWGDETWKMTGVTLN